MTNTTHLDITLVEQSQAQKEVTVNTALTRLDAILNTGAIDLGLSTPPGSPSAGDVYIVGASATGDWSGHDDDIAYFDQIWRFITPNEGMLLWVNDEDTLYVFDGSIWVSTATGGGGGGGETNTASNLGAGTGLYASKSGVDLQFKSLVAGSGISLSNDSSTVTITASGGGGGGGYATVAEEGSSLTQRTTLNFIGAGITAADNSGNNRTDVTLDGDLNALAGLSSTGLVARTASDSYALRTLTGGGGISVSNGNGVSGNPTLGISALRSQYIPAREIYPSATGGAAAFTNTTVGANRPDRAYLAFDAAGAEEAQFSFAFPKSWNEGTVAVEIFWTHPSTTTNFAVVWGIEGVALSNDDSLNSAWGAQTTITDTGGTADDVYSIVTTNFSITGSPAAGDLCYFRVMRRGVDAGDTLAVDAFLLGIKILYTIDTLDDA